MCGQPCVHGTRTGTSCSARVHGTVIGTICGQVACSWYRKVAIDTPSRECVLGLICTGTTCTSCVHGIMKGTGSGRMVCRRYRNRYPVCELRSWYRRSYQLQPVCVYAVSSFVPCTRVEYVVPHLIPRAANRVYTVPGAVPCAQLLQAVPGLIPCMPGCKTPLALWAREV